MQRECEVVLVVVVAVACLFLACWLRCFRNVFVPFDCRQARDARHHGWFWFSGSSMGSYCDSGGSRFTCCAEMVSLSRLPRCTLLVIGADGPAAGLVVDAFVNMLRKVLAVSG